MEKKPDFRGHNALVVLVVICVAAFAVLVFVEGPKIITKQVKNLELKQEGFDINVTWDEMDCRKYSVEVTCEGKTYTVPNVKKNHVELENIAVGKLYKVQVTAILNSGRESRPADAEIRTEKLPNKIRTDVQKLDGFKGDRLKIKARGTGEISFSSDNDKIADVDSKGNIRLRRSGHANIIVTATGDETHNASEKKVAVAVCPEKLKRVKGVKAENTSDSTAEISWEKTEFATEYVVMKRAAATGELETVKTVDADSTSAEIVRNTGEYAVVAKAVIGEKTARGKASETVKIKGTTEEMTSYSSWKNHRTLSRSNLEKFRTVRGDGSCRVPQSISITRDCYVISYVNSGGTAGKLCSYRKSDGECIDITPCSGMGHANGTTYDPYKDRFYVVKTHKSIRTASCSMYNGTSKKSEGTFNLPRVTSGIAYDESNNKYYLSKGNEIYVCSSDFKVEKFIHKRIRYNHAQDIGAYNGIVFVCTWVSGNSSYIDMYRASDGAYLGGYDVSFGEIESCVVDDGYLVILMNNAVGDGDCIYKTKERLPIN